MSEIKNIDINKLPANLDDHECAIINGECLCPRYNGGLPFCQKYGTLEALEHMHAFQATTPPPPTE